MLVKDLTNNMSALHRSAPNTQVWCLNHQATADKS